MIANRILTDIRDKIEPYPIPESFYFRNVPSYANGGVIPGSAGSSMIIRAHAGEEIGQPKKSLRVGNINIYMNGNATAKDVASEIEDLFSVDSSRIFQGTN
jgi:hypothetical protein